MKPIETWTVKIPLPPLSVNGAFYRNRKLTNEARQWRARFLLELQAPEHRLAMQSLYAKFDPSSMQVHVQYYFHVPRSKLLKKAGGISRRSLDVDNCIKLVQDNFFEKRYNGRVYDGTVIENVNIDDQFITHLSATKVASEDEEWYTEVTISLLPLDL